MYKHTETLEDFIEEMHSKVPGLEHIKREFYEADGLFSVGSYLPAGVSLGKHTHTYSHLSFLSSGTARVKSGDRWTEYNAPACIVIPANVEHIVTAVTDCVWYCTHATEKADPDE